MFLIAENKITRLAAETIQRVLESPWHFPDLQATTLTPQPQFSTTVSLWQRSKRILPGPLVMTSLFMFLVSRCQDR